MAHVTVAQGLISSHGEDNVSSQKIAQDPSLQSVSFLSLSHCNSIGQSLLDDAQTCGQVVITSQLKDKSTYPPTVSAALVVPFSPILWKTIPRVATKSNLLQFQLLTPPRNFDMIQKHSQRGLRN